MKIPSCGFGFVWLEPYGLRAQACTVCPEWAVTYQLPPSPRMVAEGASSQFRCGEDRRFARNMPHPLTYWLGQYKRERRWLRPQQMGSWRHPSHAHLDPELKKEAWIPIILSKYGKVQSPGSCRKEVTGWGGGMPAWQLQLMTSGCHEKELNCFSQSSCAVWKAMLVDDRKGCSRK